MINPVKAITNPAHHKTGGVAVTPRETLGQSCLAIGTNLTRLSTNKLTL